MNRQTVSIDGARFRDARGRHLILRGVNLGGDSKLPVQPDGRTFVPTDFADHRMVSFIGRPADIAEIDAHLDRISRWGFNLVRLLTTWEAVEHEGPGRYDQAYLDYFAEVCRRASARGLHVIVDFHQDAWSRMSGGSGAPGWTFEAAGLDFARFHEADAAHLMQQRYDPAKGGHQASYPSMSWNRNYAMPANGIMWTLFFAGADFAPGCMAGGINVQHYLQRHYLGAMQAVARVVSGIEHVIGFGSLNEPGEGYVGHALAEPMSRHRGSAWSPLDGLAVAAGIPRKLGSRNGEGRRIEETMNAAGRSIWLPGREDPFRQGGAWDIDADGEARALRPDYFQRVGDRQVEITRDYMAPFFAKVAETVRSVRPDWLLFLEVEPYTAALGAGLPANRPPGSVNACHWYDVTALATKRFDPRRRVHIRSGELAQGADAIEASYVNELAHMKQLGDGLNGGAPTLIGEFGIPFDMNCAEAYRRWREGERTDDVWSAQTAALELMYNAMDRLLLSSAQWNYTASNANDPMIGDGWNQEDLSIFSADQMEGQADWRAGARALDGFCRPYVMAAQGVLQSQRFDRAARSFVAVVDVDAGIDAPTEIYLPPHVFGSTPEVSLSEGTFEWSAGRHLLCVRSGTGAALTIRVQGTPA